MALRMKGMVAKGRPVRGGGRGGRGGRIQGKVEVKFDRGFHNIQRWMHELTTGKKSRVDNWQLLLVRNMADYLKAEVVKRIPRFPEEMRNYRDSIQVLDVRPVMIGGEKVVAEAVISLPEMVEVKEKDTTESVIWIKPKPNYKGHPAILILMQYQPWTLDTLPWFPPINLAKVIKSKVRQEEYEAIRDARMKDLSEVIPMLQKLKVKAKKPKRGEFQKQKVTPDIALLALRAEFGLPGALASAPHWRPALKALKKRGIQEIGEGRRGAYQKTERTLFDPTFGQWKVVPKRDTIQDVGGLQEELEPFMKKLRMASIS